MLKGLKRYFSFFGIMASSINMTINSIYSIIESLKKSRALDQVNIAIPILIKNINQTRKEKYENS